MRVVYRRKHQSYSIWAVEISLVISIEKTDHTTNSERPCTTIVFNLREDYASRHALEKSGPDEVSRVESN